MMLASLPPNCWYVFHRVARSFVHGVRHPFTHPRHVLRHIHHVRHVAPPRAWVQIVCKAAHVAGAGAAIALPPGAIVAGAPYAAPWLMPPGLEQPAPEVGSGVGGSFGGGGMPLLGGGGIGGVGGLSAYGGGGAGAMPVPTGLLPSPETVVLRPEVAATSALAPMGASSIIPPSVPVVTTVPPVVVPQKPPHSVPEPASIVLLAFGLLAAIAVSLRRESGYEK